MRFKKKLYWVIGLVVLAAIAGTGATLASGGATPSGAAGEIDDGKELLGQAEISLEEAIASALASADGSLGEVDVEWYQGKLVFNVDVEKHDVKVDALDGTVLGSVEEEADDGEDDDGVEDDHDGEDDDGPGDDEDDDGEEDDD